jgi:hypothetical protein
LIAEPRHGGVKRTSSWLEEATDRKRCKSRQQNIKESEVQIPENVPVFTVFNLNTFHHFHIMNRVFSVQIHNYR